MVLHKNGKKREREIVFRWSDGFWLEIDLGIKNRNNSLKRWRKAKEYEMRSQSNIDIDKEIETEVDLKKETDIH